MKEVNATNYCELIQILNPSIEIPVNANHFKLNKCENYCFLRSKIELSLNEM